MSKNLICIPCMDFVQTAFVQSLLGLQTVGETACSFQTSTLIYDARNHLVEEAVKGGFDRILFLDSDMVFAPDTMERLSARLDEGHDIVSALYFRRKAPLKPVVFKDVGFLKNEETYRPVAISYDDYPKDSLFECKGFGFGCVMLKTEIADKVAELYRLPFSPAMGFGEDLSFCIRLSELGIKMFCDSSIKCGHVSQRIITEEDYIKMTEGKDGQTGNH